MSIQPICIGCNRTPEEIGYGSFRDPDETDSDYVRREEGTLNPINGHFLCDTCYIKAGQPSSPTGWIAP